MCHERQTGGEWEVVWSVCVCVCVKSEWGYENYIRRQGKKKKVSLLIGL